MFLHQGQTNIKELRFHPYYREMLVTTAEDSYNIFRPNLEPDEEEEPSTTDQEESKQPETVKPVKDYLIDSDEDEVEEARMIRAAKKLNTRGEAKKAGKRRRQ